MYYDESSKLIKNNILDKDLIRRIDRELAHAFAPGGTGYVEDSLLVHRSRSSSAEIERFLALYESLGVVLSFNKVICPCGETYQPDDGQCMECGRSVSESSVTDERAYRLLKQPVMPLFDPDTATSNPNVFISYRSADSARLAADIYYSLRGEGLQVFLDQGDIPAGADAEKHFLTAASNATYFVALTSQNYFASEFCKKEIAHAARCRRRLIRVNVPPAPSAPRDMPWIDGPNWLRQEGDVSGLTAELEESLMNAVRTPGTAATIADDRYGACQYLLEQMTFTNLYELWNRLDWMQQLRPKDSKPEMIMQILQNTPSSELDVLCKALAP